jgi:transcription elongation factor Elf1
MGRRKKAAKKAVKKKRPVVAKVFKCLRCSSNGSVHCSLDYKQMLGQLVCNVCKVKYATKIHKLTQPIDVFTEWLDAAIDLQAGKDVPRFENVAPALTAQALRQASDAQYILRSKPLILIYILCSQRDTGEDIRDDEVRSVDSKSVLSNDFIDHDDDEEEDDVGQDEE